MNLIELARQAIAVDSTSSNGNYEMARWIGGIAADWGMNVEFLEENLNGVPQQNVIIRPSESLRVNEVLFLNHLDTPDPGSYGLWTKNLGNPFKASIYEDTIFGIGVANAKLDFVAKLLAAQKFANVKQKSPFALVGTYGGHQEMSLSGAIKLIRRKAVNAKSAFVGEPTQGQLTHAGSGITMVEVILPFSNEEIEFQQKHDQAETSSSQTKIFRGKAALASHPKLGENAIVQMFEYLENLPEGIAVLDMDGGISANTVPSSSALEIDLAGGLKNTVSTKLLKIMNTMKEVELEFEKYLDEGFDPSCCTWNIGQVRKQRDHIRVLGSCRIMPSVSEDVSEKWMNELRGVCEKVGARFQIITHKRPFETPPDSNIVVESLKIVAELGLSSNLVKTTACTEANVLSHFGIESIVWGPGQGVGNTHEPNERISIIELEQAIEFYSRVMEKFCIP